MTTVAGVGARAEPTVGSAPEQARLREACESFEAIFLTLLFREMKAAAPREGLLSGGIGGEIFNGLWAEELGRVGARASPLGIADMLFGKLSSDLK